eukprot:scaffold14402_cov63-Phaeocystis_antarctica.AAC.2
MGCSAEGVGEICCPDRQLAVPTVEGGVYERCEDQTLRAQAQHAAEISMAELHAAILDLAAVRSG